MYLKQLLIPFIHLLSWLFYDTFSINVLFHWFCNWANSCSLTWPLFWLWSRLWKQVMITRSRCHSNQFSSLVFWYWDNSRSDWFLGSVKTRARGLLDFWLFELRFEDSRLDWNRLLWLNSFRVVKSRARLIIFWIHGHFIQRIDYLCVTSNHTE